LQAQKSGSINVLLLGVEPSAENALRKYATGATRTPVKFHSAAQETWPAVEPTAWDLIVLDWSVRSSGALAKAIKRNSLQGLKIVLTEKENLDAAIEFWGAGIYRYLLKPINRELFQLVWQSSQERMALDRKLSRLEKERRKQRAKGQEQQEISKDLFVMHLKMQAMVQDKTNFLAMTSHELRTPLAALQGYLELLHGGKMGPLEGLQADVVARSLESSRRMLRLVNSLADLSALHGREKNLQLEQGDIRKCVARSVCDLKHAAEKRGVFLELACGVEMPLFRFDFDRMGQVATNLVENAIKFTPAGGTIRVRCEPYSWERRSVHEMIRGATRERRNATQASDANSVQIVVEDTGVGIPGEFLNEIFEEYLRAPNGNGSKGLGLGLAVVRQIVAAHEGKIWAESQVGQGSVFTVLIPIS
jgi:signal transduction histidine kinase